MRKERANRRGWSVAAMDFTKLGGLRTGDVDFLSRKRTVRGGHLQGFRINEDGVDALGLFKVLDVAVAR